MSSVLGGIVPTTAPSDQLIDFKYLQLIEQSPHTVHFALLPTVYIKDAPQYLC